MLCLDLSNARNKTVHHLITCLFYIIYIINYHCFNNEPSVVLVAIEWGLPLRDLNILDPPGWLHNYLRALGLNAI